MSIADNPCFWEDVSRDKSKQPEDFEPIPLYKYEDIPPEDTDYEAEKQPSGSIDVDIDHSVDHTFDATIIQM